VSELSMAPNSGPEAASALLLIVNVLVVASNVTVSPKVFWRASGFVASVPLTVKVPCALIPMGIRSARRVIDNSRFMIDLI
jgi:hypothetical protein